MPPFPSRPDPPEFFIDRSLGYYLIPAALRDLGHTVHTMRSVFGTDAEERIPDPTWLAAAGSRRWVVLTKDGRMRHRPAELEAVTQHRLRVFCLANASLTGPEQAQRIASNIHRIVARAHRPGPWIDAIYRDRVTRLWPRQTPPGPR
ncbi:MAG TPA: hypothetical protein VMX37_00940 [Acidimicrobiia bacterium]|nr:hypothetical protein [Acidimicrobiia bacterium]